MQLLQHQKSVLEQTKEFQNVGYFLDMGLGKTFVGAEKMRQIGNAVNLLVCQKSKIDDWQTHFETHYKNLLVFDLTKPAKMKQFLQLAIFHGSQCVVGIINYELLFRREQLQQLNNFTLMLDESSLMQNENAQRSKYILKKLHYSNVILLSGTVVNGNYEKLWSQCNLLGWSISKDLFYKQYLTFETIKTGGFYHKIKTGYKNIDRLKRKLSNYGAVFMQTSDVFDLPEQNIFVQYVKPSKIYRDFDRDKIVSIEHQTFIGDMKLTERLYKRLLCGAFCESKINYVLDLIESTSDRLIIFYNFNAEIERLREKINPKRPVSVVSGEIKDLKAYEQNDDSITFVQYQAGAMGLNLQKANKIIYFTLPDGGAELFEQSKKRIHRIGQNRPCFYYILLCKNTIEEEIFSNVCEKSQRIKNLFE